MTADSPTPGIVDPDQNVCDRTTSANGVAVQYVVRRLGVTVFDRRLETVFDYLEDETEIDVGTVRKIASASNGPSEIDVRDQTGPRRSTNAVSGLRDRRSHIGN